MPSGPTGSCRDGAPGGESPEQIGARADRVIRRIRAVDGNTLLFSSGHFLRVFAARWLGLEPGAGKYLFLGTASLSALGYEHDHSDPVIRLWDETPPEPPVRRAPGARAPGESTTMSTHNSSPNTMAALRRQYGCGPIELTGFADALYERHLFFDNVIDAGAGARERYEAFARSVRDVLSQRWVRTEQTYEHANPKPVVRADDAGPPRTGEWIPQIDALRARRPRLATSRMRGSCRCGRA